jgi:hypothetical protein
MQRNEVALPFDGSLGRLTMRIAIFGQAHWAGITNSVASRRKDARDILFAALLIIYQTQCPPLLVSLACLMEYECDDKQKMLAVTRVSVMSPIGIMSVEVI